ncbi:hypothetical protein ID866_8023, partial [Astraeus odoratus]
MREIHVWSKLSHKNVLPLLGITTEFNHGVSTISPWMENGNAHDYVQNRDIDPRPLLAGIAAGLLYLHNFEPDPICHGDLKGSNVLISDDGDALLADFGLSFSHGQAFDSYSIPKGGGTLNWMAPEYLESQECSLTVEGDVWAFGMTVLVRLQTPLP